MSRWFRFYDESVNDPKLLRLPDDLYRAWTILLCFASKNEGVLPPAADIALALRVKPSKVAEWITKLVVGELIDDVSGRFEPHNWNGRQYKTDNSTDRVQKYRKKRKDAGLPVLGDYSAFRPHLKLRDGECCIYCEATSGLVVDHMVPIALGGTDDLDNLALACKGCNSGKAGRTPELASMTISVTSAALALSSYRDKKRDVTVTVTSPEQKQITEQSRAEPRDDLKIRTGNFQQAIVQAFAAANSPNLPETSRAGLWLSQGYQEDICLAIVSELVRKKPSITTLNYFDNAIKEAHASKAPPRQPIVNRPEDVNWDAVLKTFKETGHWSRWAGPDLSSPACRAPPEMLTKHGILPDGRTVQ